MTTIIAIEHENGVTFGFDSKVSYGSEHADLEGSKVFANGEVVFGICGAVLDANIFRYAELPKLDAHEWDIDRWVTTQLLPALHSALRDRGALEVSNGKLSTGGGILLAIRGRVYQAAYDGSWTRHTNKLYSIGSGSSYALGALAVGASVREALRAAEVYDKGTGHRLQVLLDSQIIAGEVPA